MQVATLLVWALVLPLIQGQWLPPGADGTIRFSQEVFLKALLVGPVPVYPAGSKRDTKDGPVAATIRVRAQGDVSSVSIEGQPGADVTESIEKALLKWRFRPTLFRGIAHPVVCRILIYFRRGPHGGEVLVPGLEDYRP
jgi:TonB family protein